MIIPNSILCACCCKHFHISASSDRLVNIAGTNPNSVESSIWGKTNKNCMTCGMGNHCYDLMYRSNWSFNMPHPNTPPGHTPGIWQLCRPREEGIWLSESSRGWGIWSPCFRGGEFELHPRFHVKSLAWQAIMGNGVLEYFCGKDCAFFCQLVMRRGLKQALCHIWSI